MTTTTDKGYTIREGISGTYTVIFRDPVEATLVVRSHHAAITFADAVMDAYREGYEDGASGEESSVTS